MIKVFKKDQWLLCYSPMLSVPRLPDDMSQNLTKAYEKDSKHSLSVDFPGIPVPVWARLEYLGEGILDGGEAVSFYKNLDIKEVQPHNKQLNKHIDSFYAIYAESELNEAVKAKGSEGVWLSRFFLNGNQGFLLNTPFLSQKETDEPSYATIISAIYAGEDMPREAKLAAEDIIDRYSTGEEQVSL